MMPMLMTVDPQERSTWRSGVGSAMPPLLPGKGPTDVHDAPAPDYDMRMLHILGISVH